MIKEIKYQQPHIPDLLNIFDAIGEMLSSVDPAADKEERALGIL